MYIRCVVWLLCILFFFGYKEKVKKNLKINGNKSVNEGVFFWSYFFKVG